MTSEAPQVNQTGRKPGRVGDGTPGPGRPKGSKNKLGASAKDAFQAAFDELGGYEGLVAWAAKDDGKNLGEFYKLYARLIPMEVTGKDGKDLIPASPLEVAREMAFMLELAQRPPTQH